MDFGFFSDVLAFFGRLHPLVVHFPIGILLLAAVLEVIARMESARRLAHAVPFVLALGALGATMAAVTGYVNSLDGRYDEVLIAWHMWLGFGVCALSLAALMLKLLARRHPSRPVVRVYGVFLSACVVTLVFAGHYGGAIARGPGYLTNYLPEPLGSWFSSAGTVRPGTFDDVESARLFHDLVHPILERHCTGCHGAARAESNFRMDDPAEILKGGDSGRTIVAGDPGRSDLVRRIILPPYHKDFMPPEGRAPLSLEEIELIRWWVERGASLEQTVGQARRQATPPPVQVILNRLSRPQEERPRGIFALKVPPPQPEAVQALRDLGARVSQISQGEVFLEVDFSEREDLLGPEHLDRLAAVGQQIAWLKLTGCRIAPERFGELAGLKHLTRLHLERSNVSDADLVHLKQLEHLEYLNLYGTGVTDAGLTALAELKSLRSLFLWQTGVTPEGVRALQQRIPSLNVNVGFAAEGVPSNEISPPASGEEDPLLD